jgi:predicted transposase/invertase (TIGR01784 family)
MSIYNPRVDFAFKKLFGSDLLSLTALINAILPENEQLTEVTLLNPFNEKSFSQDKLSVLDIKAIDGSGRHYNIEMQVTDEVYYSQRALYYWSKIYANQLKKGENYDNLRKTISIHVLNFNCFAKETDYHNVFHLLNAKSHRRDFEDMELHFIELQKFTKGFDELTTPLDHWTSFLTSADRYDKTTMPVQLKNDPNIRRAIDTLEHLYLTDEEREIYEARLKWLRDEQGAIKSAERKALIKGREEGLAEGIEKGREEGREEGRTATKHEIARSLLAAGLPPSIVSESTGLSLEQIEALKK